MTSFVYLRNLATSDIPISGFPGWTYQWVWLCWGFKTRQPLCVILCPLPEKGRKVVEEIVEEIKERDREERGTGIESEETEEIKKTKKHPPSTLSCYKDSRPCPAVSQYQLDAPVTQDTQHLRTIRPPGIPVKVVLLYWHWKKTPHPISF